jgi:PAS domain S-box-containing protein
MVDKLSLLVVDDREDNLHLIETLINEFFSNIEIFRASSARDGLLIAAEQNIDCALVDVQMPRMGGIEMCDWLKSNDTTKSISIILLTSHQTTAELRAEGLSAGADDFILRPFDIDEFVARVKVMFRGKRAEKELRTLNDRLGELVLERTEKLRKSEAKYHSYVENAPDGIFVFDRVGKYVDVNRAACEMTGYNERELTAMGITDLICSEDKEDAQFCIDQLLTDGQVYHESGYITKSGEARHWAINAVTLDEHQFLGFVKDITKRREQEQQREALEEQLRQAQKMEAVGRLAGGVAHDFNNMLTAIIGFSEVVYEALSELDPLREDVREIRRAADSAASLTQQLLAFSRKQIIHPKVLNLNQRIADSENMLRRMIGEDIELRVIPDLGLGKVLFDSGQVDQILLNLAVNARDAMPHGGKLTIETKNSMQEEGECLTCAEKIVGDFVMMTISDNGIGMNEEELSRIFEPFYTTKKKNEGTGLGLSTIHGIVHQNNGHINVYSEPGHGTIFKIYIPLVDAEEDADTSSAPGQEVGGNETILLVEDQELVRRLAKRLLNSNGYHVIEAEHGGEALEKYIGYAGEIELLLTDVVMPQMSGKQLYDRLAKLTPELKVLYMSGYTENVIAHHGVLDEGTNFIQKPFNRVEILQKIRSVLDTNSTDKGKLPVNKTV